MIYWAHIVTTGAIVVGSSIEDVLRQLRTLDSAFYGPVYMRYDYPAEYSIAAFNFNSRHVFEVL